MLALLRGLYEPDEGVQVKVDGAAQDGFTMINGNVTLFPQEPEIFENTIEYNITLGLPFERAEVEAICETVGFTEIVKQLPNGFESSIKEKGVNLSGRRR